MHLRFGTVSIRELAGHAHARAQAGSSGAATWLSELIWRDFYFQVLANFPHVVDGQGQSHSFRREYDKVQWKKGKPAQALFAAWCEGRTATLVDAAMRRSTRPAKAKKPAAWWGSVLCRTGPGLEMGERYFAKAAQIRIAAQRRLAVGQLQRLRRAAVFRIFIPSARAASSTRGPIHLKYLQMDGLPPMPCSPGLLRCGIGPQHHVGKQYRASFPEEARETLARTRRQGLSQTCATISKWSRIVRRRRQSGQDGGDAIGLDQAQKLFGVYGFRG